MFKRRRRVVVKHLSKINEVTNLKRKIYKCHIDEYLENYK